MKEAELRKTMTCVVCAKKILHTGIPLFWRITVERFGVDLQALRRRAGLAMQMGSQQLARIMGPDDDVAKSVHGPIDIAICDNCACGDMPPLMVLLERQAPSADEPPEALPS